MAAAEQDPKQPRWRAHNVPGLSAPADGLLWNDSMIDTYKTHYNTYYTQAGVDAAISVAPAPHFDVALQWVGRMQRQSWQHLECRSLLLCEVRQRGVEMEARAKDGGDKGPGTWTLVERKGGKRAAQS